MRCAVYKVLLPVMMITAHRQTHAQTHTHRETKTVYPPLSLRSLGGYNNTPNNITITRSFAPASANFVFLFSRNLSN